MGTSGESYVVLLFAASLCVIIAFMLSGIFVGIGAALVSLAGILLARTFSTDATHILLIRSIAGGLLLLSLYLFVEAVRFGWWRFHFYNGSDDTATKNPPKVFILSLIANIWKFGRGSESNR